MAQDMIALITIITFVGLIFFFAYRTQKQLAPPLRPIAAFERLKHVVAQAIESGQMVHVSLGRGGISSMTTADTLAGLVLLDYVAAQMAAVRTVPIVTTADPAAALAAQDRLRHAYQQVGFAPHQVASQTRWFSTDPAAFAVGTMTTIASEPISANVLLGHFGDEYLLIGETAQQAQAPEQTIAGTSDPNLLPYLYTTAGQGLWAEEMYAASAYLEQKPIQIGSLLAQDTLRWGMALLILGAVLLRAIGIIG